MARLVKFYFLHSFELVLHDVLKRNDMKKILLPGLILILAAVQFFCSCTDHVADHVQKGDIYMSVNQWEQAVDEYSEAMKLNQTDAEIYYKRGIAYRKAQNYPAAVNDFSQAVNLAPEMARAYADRGLTLAIMADIDMAIQDMDKAIDLDQNMARAVEDDMAEAYFKLGVAYRQRGKRIHR